MATISYNLVDIDKATGCGELVIKLTITRTNRPVFRTGLHVNSAYFKVVKITEAGEVYDVIAPRINKKKTNVEEVEQVREVRDKLRIFSNKLLRICEHLQSFPEFKITKDVIQQSLDKLGEFTLHDEEMTFLHITEVLGNSAQINDVWSGGEPFFKLLTLMLKEKGSSSSNPKEYVRNYMALAHIAKRFELYTRLSNNAMRDFYLNPRTMNCTVIEQFRVYMMTERDLYLTNREIFDRIAEIDPDCMFHITHRGNPMRNKSENYIKMILQEMKTLFHWIVNTGYTDNWPFKGVNVGDPNYGTPYYLTIDERNIIADYDLSATPRLAVIRDAFIFQCLTGCRYSDLLSLTRKNISKGRLKYIPQKTSGKRIPTMVIVPLCDRAKAMIKRHRDKERKTLFDLPVTKNYNIDLQNILTICGIQRPVIYRDPTTGTFSYRPINEIATSHIARRTFVGNAYKKVKDPNLIGKMSGHIDGSRSFLRYRDIDDEDLWEVINKII